VRFRVRGHGRPHGGGRRRLGRGADAFLHEVLADVRTREPGARTEFHLYGHSAGAQFASRYVVKHPERIARAVLCAGGTFAFPDPDVPWTNGMAKLERRIRWSDDAPWEHFEYTPDPAGWVAAAELPIAVVVGAEDTDPIPAIPGQVGDDHVERAVAWVKAMKALAAEHRTKDRLELAVVRGVGHDSEGLTPVCRAFIAAGL